MWDNTFLMYSADNGGVGDGINWPLRGEKHSNWEGGMRTAAFVSGGLIPAQLRGTTNGVNMHIVDWYATFSTLAGVDPTDSPKVAPLSVDLKNTTKNIYGDDSFPPLDGVDVMPYLLAGAGKSAFDAAHKYLVISKEVVIAGKWKLLVSQPSFKSQNNGWKGKDGKWRTPNKTESHDCMAQNHAPGGAAHVLPVPKAGGHACLYDLRADPGEHVDVSQANKDVVAELTNQLNLIILTQRDCNGWTYKSADSSYDIPGPLQPDGTRSCSPSALLGYCDQGCANALWASYGKADGPICGVPNCTNASAL
jgi:arylsulfatase A-like enzyme